MPSEQLRARKSSRKNEAGPSHTESNEGADEIKVLRDTLAALEQRAKLKPGALRDEEDSHDKLEHEILKTENELREAEKKGKESPRQYTAENDNESGPHLSVASPSLPEEPMAPPTLSEVAPEASVSNPMATATVVESPFIGRNSVLERVSNGNRPNPAELAAYISKQKEHDAVVAERREMRSEKFAEKFGLTELRDAKIAAEKKAYAEDVKMHKNPLRVAFEPTREKRNLARRKADKATLAWSQALANLPEGASSRDRLEAMVLRDRDTIIGPTAMRTQARVDALDERGKTLFGQVLNTPMFIAKGYVKAASGASSGIGRGLFGLFGNKNLKEEALVREQEKYRRAGQVIMGATIGTAIGVMAAPGTVAAAAGAAGFAAFVGLRSLLGVHVGVAAAKGAQKINKATFDKSTKEDYRTAVRTTNVETVEQLQMQQRAGKHGSRNARISRNQAIGIGAAVIGAGATAGGVGEMMHLHSVQAAIHTHGPLAAHPHAPAHHVQPKVPMHKLEMSIGGKNAEGMAMNDADKLFGHFGLMLQRDFAHVAHPHTPAIDTYLKLLEPKGGHGVSLQHGEDQMARAFGFENAKKLSEVMHNGDTIHLNHGGQIAIEWADHTRPPHVLIDADGGVNSDIDDLTSFMKGVHAHAAHATSEHATPGTGGHIVNGHVSLRDQRLSAEVPDGHQATYNELGRMREAAYVKDLRSQYDALMSQRSVLAAHTHDPNYSNMLKHYTADDAAYRNNIAAYSAAHGHAAPSVPAQHSAQTHETATPAHTSSVAEAIPVGHSAEAVPASIAKLTHDSGWNDFKGYGSLDVLNHPADPDEFNAILIRDQFVAIVKESGVAPIEHQSIEQYVALAEKAIQAKAGK